MGTKMGTAVQSAVTAAREPVVQIAEDDDVGLRIGIHQQ